MRRFTLSLIAACLLSSTVFAAPPAILPVPDASEIWTAIESLEVRVARLEKQSASVAVEVLPSVAVKPAVVVKSAPAAYAPRWHSNDGRSLRQHAIEIHGMDPNLSDAELARQHDAWHDHNGPIAPRTSAAYSQQWQPATRSRSVQFSSGTSNCPGGVCPTSRSVNVQSSGGMFGFGIVGRRR